MNIFSRLLNATIAFDDSSSPQSAYSITARFSSEKQSLRVSQQVGSILNYRNAHLQSAIYRLYSARCNNQIAARGRIVLQSKNSPTSSLQHFRRGKQSAVASTQLRSDASSRLSLSIPSGPYRLGAISNPSSLRQY